MKKLCVEVAVPAPVDRLFSYLPAEQGDLPERGTRVIVPFGRRTVTGVVMDQKNVDTEPGFQLKPISRVLDEEPLVDAEWLEMARWVSRMYLASLGETLATMLPGARRTRELPERGGDEPTIAPERLTLSDEQNAAIEAIAQPVQPGEESWHYLYGITGSGKTEVFLQLAQRTLGSGRSVIYLVPEIALTHQLFEHISRRFGPLAAMLHSGLTASQRFGEWRRIQRGEARLVVGARSAVFAPVVGLGLVIIDEEHESSYKAGNAPRYHARQVALWRAVRAGAPCVMGSATPSIEAWHLMEAGRLVRHVLTHRLSGGALPRISVVNVRGSSGLISAPLKEALLATHRAGGQSILFLNRRGFAGAFQCRSCGYSTDCPRCSVTMTFHKRENRLVCHYCGYRMKPVEVCPECGSLDVGYSVFGTERVEEEVQQALPDLRIARLDTDTTQVRGAVGEVLDRFGAREIDILLGTQMVAKGLNFPGVRTVGIVMADTGLNLPDFRAAERTFGLIIQVAGRAGRFRTDGEVIVQTVRPDHAAIQRAVRMEIETFYRDELAVRHTLQFPPFTRLIRLVFRSRNREAAAEAAQEFARRASAAVGNYHVLGPAPAPLERIKNNWRHHVLLRGEHLSELHAMCRNALTAAHRNAKVYTEVDVDPVNLL